MSRKLPEGEVDKDFVPPQIIHSNGYSIHDYNLIQSIRRELISSGVIDSESALREDTQSIDELRSILQEANAHALSEKDFNAEFYDRESTENLDRIDEENPDTDNLMLDY